ncbi:unnamed protein product [Parascedosporium putredinis]|uniref:BZIP domain-containing protein n=1 Tax=Parascedosporium putredinis TaxID=1442378 RepID=A0A9P1H9N1_9PEZI|nr:unnamed protein product [Parascedosporium putredinis]CAI8000354.1 unnamed protein product [Parascedosporium putredinis]
MASTESQSQRPSVPYYLSPQQQQLLLAALGAEQQRDGSIPLTSAALSSLQNGSMAATDHSADLSGFQDSSFIDGYDVSFNPDSSFDFDISHASIPHFTDGDLAETVKSENSGDNDSPDKRPLEDDEDSPDAKGNDAKRRDGSEKVPKKPGRKPLTSEPTSKRKAQNRAAQRAFRERKEKHLKDLETKVEELEKKSETATSENAVLRKQLRSVLVELDEYKRKVQVIGNTRSTTRDRVPRASFGQPAVNNLNDVHFQFEFPRFGFLPGPPANSKPVNGQHSSSASPQTQSNYASPTDASSNKQHNSPATASVTTPNLGGNTLLNSPSSQADHSSVLNGGRNSLDSGRHSLGTGATSSPSGSYNSVGGPSSSCGTSPEPFNQSPMGFKPLDTMTTIGEEHPALQTSNGEAPTGFGQFPGDVGFDWLAQQNGGQFDPQLFGDYREPQNNILSGNNFDDSFFNEAIDADFFTPFNVPASSTPVVSPPQNGIASDLAMQSDAASSNNALPGEKKVDCMQVWEQIQSCDKKAKCSGDGPKVKEQDFEAVLGKYLGPDFLERCGKGSST